MTTLLGPSGRLPSFVADWVDVEAEADDELGPDGPDAGQDSELTVVVARRVAQVAPTVAGERGSTEVAVAWLAGEPSF